MRTRKLAVSSKKQEVSFKHADKKTDITQSAYGLWHRFNEITERAYNAKSSEHTANNKVSKPSEKSEPEKRAIAHVATSKRSGSRAQLIQHQYPKNL